MQRTPQQGMITAASTVTVATVTRGVTYEEVTDLRGNKPSTSTADTPVASQLGTDHSV